MGPQAVDQILMSRQFSHDLQFCLCRLAARFVEVDDLGDEWLGGTILVVGAKDLSKAALAEALILGDVVGGAGEAFDANSLFGLHR